MSPSLNAKIAEVFDEPGCDINQAKGAKERKKGCTKQLTPGAAAGGCAFDGAKIALQPIVDVAHLVHGPIACEGNSWDNRHSGSSGPMTYRSGFTTDITELDVIYGGEKRLFKSIREIIEKYDPPAVFVYQTCVTGMIGDDIEAVCQRARERFGKPVIPVNAPGFAGPKNLGNKLGAEALLEHVIGTMEPEHTTPTDLNIIGEYNLSGELWQVKPLLDALGVRVLSCISGDGRYREVASAHRARANMMVCSKSMINIATRMQQRWGIPYFEGSFYGISDMSTTLREIARLLVERGAPADLRERTEALVAVDVARAVDENFRDLDPHDHLRAMECRQARLHQRVVAADRGLAVHAHAMRRFEIDEQQADLAVAGDVAHRQIHAVAVQAGEGERAAVDHLHEAGIAALVRHGRVATVVYCAEEEEIARFDEALVFGRDFRQHDDVAHAVGQDPLAFRCCRRKIHVTTQYGGFGSRKHFEGSTTFFIQVQALRHGTGFDMAVADGLNLHVSLMLGVIFEMCRHDMYRSKLGDNDCFEKHSLHTGSRQFGCPG